MLKTKVSPEPFNRDSNVKQLGNIERRRRNVMSILILGLCSMAWAVPLENVENVPLSRHQLSIWNQPEFHQALAESYLAKTDIEPAITPAELEKLQKIFELRKEEKIDEAVQLLMNKYITETSSAVFDLTLANLYYEQNNYEAAVEFSQKAIDKDPPKTHKYLRAWERLAWSYVSMEEFAKAIPAFIKVIELGGHSSYNYGMLGYSYGRVENYLCAETAYRTAIMLDSKQIDWKAGLAQSLYMQQRYSEVASYCDTLIQTYPNNHKFWLLQANAYLGLKELDKAAVNFEMVDHLGQSTDKLLYTLGDIYINQELYDTGVSAYVRAIEKNPHHNPESRVLSAAKILTARGALAETKALINSIETLQGSYIGTQDKKELLRLKARIAVAEGAGDDEIAILEEIITLDPLDGDALILSGQYYQRKEQPEKAIFYYERAAGIEGFEAEAKLRHGQLLVSQGKYTEALNFLRRAYEMEPREQLQKYVEQVERVAKAR